MPARPGEEHGMSFSFEWQSRPSVSIVGWLRKLFVDLDAALTDAANNRAEDIQTWMQENAVWEDRTGYAREHLLTDIERFQDGLNIWLFYQEVPYDVYLETMQAGKFSILGPAIDYWGPILMNDVRSILGL